MTWQSRIIGEGVEDPNQLLANPANWRIHPQAQQDALSGVLDEVGWIQRVIVNQRTGFVLDGHLRVALAITRGEAEVPVVYVDLSPDEERLVLATLDPLGAMAVADGELLRDLLGEVQTESAAVVELLASLREDANRLARRQEETNPDDVPVSIPKTPITQPGDIWVLGRHRLICGDATDPDVWDRLVGTPRIPLIVTSPPYPGAAMWNETNESGMTENIDRLRELNADVFALAARYADVVCWNVADVPVGNQNVMWNSSDVLRFAADNDCTTVRPILWDKGIPDPLPPPSFMRRPVVAHITHEWLFVVYPEGWHAREKRSGLDTDEHTWQLRSVWSISPDSAKRRGHPAPFPVDLADRCVRLFSLPDDVVLDPFAGSGSTIIACEQNGRAGAAIELDPGYCDLIVARWSQMTGETPDRA
jgi:DNA modification methylase